MNKIDARILNLLDSEGETRRSYLYRRILSKSGEIQRSVIWLEEKEFIHSRFKRNRNKGGQEPEMLDITEAGRAALKAYYN